ncbi:hypothetical protein K503DRAFT_778104 [Rhizopogon vinicolor AM-OR11-026]|uniref:Uncharacterized protein n=1 Tax=Rhizopogon vinicolor AM-OR11-026 TaxID=1314800 RepID=A0A1B7MDD8_9AGAM|nr:hypothetical protein K503DRAFT_778104 [Rhizopogon vinicolor AM-OR11-026]
MAQYDPSEPGFIDETSKDERIPGRRYGWSKKGKRVEKQQVFVVLFFVILSIFFHLNINHDTGSEVTIMIE